MLGDTEESFNTETFAWLALGGLCHNLQPIQNTGSFKWVQSTTDFMFAIFTHCYGI